MLRNPRRPSFNNRHCVYCHFGCAARATRSGPRKSSFTGRHCANLSKHCALQSQGGHQQQALRLLLRRRWSYHTLWAQKTWLHQKALRVRQRFLRRPPAHAPRGLPHPVPPPQTGKPSQRSTVLSSTTCGTGKSSNCFMVGSSMTCGTGTSTNGPVRHIKEDANLLTVFPEAANSTPISSSVLVTGGFTSTSASRCQKRYRPLRCHGHCEACQNKGT